MSLIDHAIKKEKELAAWDLWKALYPNMNKNSWISFEDFKKKVISERNIYTHKDYEDIKNEMDAVVKAFKGR